MVIDTARAIFDALTLRPRRSRSFVMVGFDCVATDVTTAGIVVSITAPSATGTTSGTVVDVVLVVVVVVVVGTTLSVLTAVAEERLVLSPSPSCPC